MNNSNSLRKLFTTSEDAYQRMLHCQPGDAFHEMFTHVVRVRSLAGNKVIVTEHTGTGPAKRQISFNSKEDFANRYAYGSEAMKHKSTLRWAPTGFGSVEPLVCICEPVDLLNNGCICK
jgi:hypothetical protein